MNWGIYMKTKEKVLVVDDKGMNRYMLGGIFRDDYDVVEAAGGVEAIELCKREHEDLAVILLDILMPGVDGFGVLDYLKNDNMLCKVPVVVVTDDTSEETSSRAFSYDIADMVIKPYEPKVIKRRVQNIIELYAYREMYGA